MTPFSRPILGWIAACVAAASASALSVVPPTFRELVAEADTIVLGTVQDVSARKVRNAAGREVIKTFVRVQVDEALKGSPGNMFELVLLGGSTGREATIVPGMPQFEVGSREFIFAARNGQVICPLVGAGHGAYQVSTDTSTGRSVVRRRDGTPLSTVNEVGLPLSEGAAGRGGPVAAASGGLGAQEFRQAIIRELTAPAQQAR